MRRLVLSVVALVVCAYPVLAQNTVPVPALGYVLDTPNKSIRPIWGIAGSAVYGSALNLGFEIASAAISASPEIALLANADGVFILAAASGPAPPAQVNGASGSPDLLAISRSGAFGAAYYSETKTLLTIGPLTDPAPQTREVLLPQLADVPAALAISDDGLSATLIVNSTGDAASGAVLRADCQSGELRQLATVADGASVAFLPGDNDIVVADRGGPVFVVRDISGDASRTDLLSGDDRLPAPSSAVVSADATSVFATGSGGSLAILSLAGADPVFLSCSCTPANPRRLNGKSAFLVSDIRDGVAWMLDADIANPRVLFIPPGQDEE